MLQTDRNGGLVSALYAKAQIGLSLSHTHTVEKVFFAYDTNTALPSTSNGCRLLMVSSRFVLSRIELISMKPNERLVLVTSSRITFMFFTVRAVTLASAATIVSSVVSASRPRRIRAVATSARRLYFK